MYHQEAPTDVVTGSLTGPADSGHSGLPIKQGRSGNYPGPSLLEITQRASWLNAARVNLVDALSLLLHLGESRKPSLALAGLHVERDRIRFRGEILEFLDT